jgi:hypothetical protein
MLYPVDLMLELVFGVADTILGLLVDNKPCSVQ